MSGRSLIDRSDEDLATIAAAAPESAPGRAAASELLSRHQRRVYLWCFQYVREHERALELAQDVMLKAYRSLAQFRKGSRFTSWLFIIARNTCLSSFRTPGLVLGDDAVMDRTSDPAKGPEQLVAEKMEEQELSNLMERTLDRQEQAALLLRCYEKLPVDEITRILAITAPSGARGLLQTARRKLRAALAERAQGGAT